MRITLQYVEGCPGRRLVEERLREALAALGLEADAALVLEPVRTPDQARTLGFVGSPTLLVDGRDPFAAEGRPAALACRLYQTADGPQQAPTVAELRAVLAR